jgi:hypothetical protein
MTNEDITENTKLENILINFRSTCDFLEDDLGKTKHWLKDFLLENIITVKLITFIHERCQLDSHDTIDIIDEIRKSILEITK